MTLNDASKLDRARLLIETLGLISQVGDAEDLEIADLMILEVRELHKLVVRKH